MIIKPLEKTQNEYEKEWTQGSIGAKGYTVNIAELMEERDMLALENKHLAEHLLQNGHTKNEVDSIAKGFKDWKEKGDIMKYKVEWWETRQYYCSIDIEADNEDNASSIALTPYAKGCREWNKDELATYFEDIKDTDGKDIIKVTEKIKTKNQCSSCGESSDKEDFTMDEDYDYDVCDTCYQENYGK